MSELVLEMLPAVSKLTFLPMRLPRTTMKQMAGLDVLIRRVAKLAGDRSRRPQPIVA